MDKSREDIINGIIESKQIEKKIRSEKIPSKYIKDLIQDIYLIFLEMPDEKIKKLDEDNMIDYWIYRIIINNFYSKTSEFYYKYRKFNDMTEEINDDKTIDYEGVED